MVKTTNTMYNPTYYGTTMTSKGLCGTAMSAVTPGNIVPLAFVLGGFILFALDAIMDHGYAFSVRSGDTAVSFGPGIDPIYPEGFMDF
jgi:hypothetical protein